MAYFFPEPSRTFSEYLLVPGYSSSECIPANVSLKTPVVKYRRGEEPSLTMNVPMVSAVMQAVSGEKMGIALAREGGIAFIYVSQPINEQAEMVRKVKNYKAGFVTSDSNLRLEDTLADVLALKERTGHSTMAVTDDGTGTGKLLGLVTSRDYRVSRMDPATSVKEFMTPAEKVISAPEGTSLKTANDIIWDHKLNALPILTADGHLVSFVFRKDYDSHKGNPLELLDSQKRYVVGAGINTRDYAERVPALVDAGVDVLVIDSSEGYSEWQARTLKWIRDHYGDTVKVGAVYHVAGTHFHSVTVVVPDPLQGPGLPFGVALGGVDDQHVHPGVHQGRDPLRIVPGIDAGAYHIALLAVQQLQGIALVGVIVLAEHS